MSLNNSKIRIAAGSIASEAGKTGCGARFQKLNSLLCSQARDPACVLIPESRQKTGKLLLSILHLENSERVTLGENQFDGTELNILRVNSVHLAYPNNSIPVHFIIKWKEHLQIKECIN